MENNLLAFDAIVFSPIVLHMLKAPRVHAVVGPGVVFWVQIDPDAPLLETVPAVAILDELSYFGSVATANIGIGCRNEKVTFYTEKLS